MPSRFLNNININDSYTLPVADGVADQIITTDGAGQLSFMDQGDVIAGEADKAKSVILRVKNSTLSAMTKGQVICENVSISPPSGNLIEVGLADNNAAGRMPALGILNEDLDAAGGNKDEGDAIMFGKVSGIDTSAFSVGDEVFVSDVPGGLTTTKPTGVKYIQKVGVVIRDDNNNGTIEVFGAGRVNDVPTPLYVDHANQRLGIGEGNPDALLHLSGNSPTIKLEDDVASDYYNPKIEFYGSTFGGSVGFLSNPAIETLQLQYTSIALAKTTYLRLKNGEADFSSNVTNGTTLKTDGVLQVAGSNDSYFSNGNVGIGTTNPTTKLEVQDGSIKLNSTSGYPSTNSIIATWNGSSSPPMGNLSWHQSPGFIGSEWSHYKQSSPYTQARIRLIGDASSGGMFVNLNGSDVFTIQTSTSNVGIGTTNPQAKLQVNTVSNINAQFGIDSFGSFKLGDIANNYTGAGVFYSGSPGSEDLQVWTNTFRISGNGGAGIQTVANGDVYLNTQSGVLATLDDSTNNFGIGTTNPSAKLDVVQSTAANGAAALHLIGPNTNPALTSSVLIIEQGDGKKITMDGNDIDVSSGDLFINDYSKEDVTFGGQIKVNGGGSPVGDSYIANGNFGIGTTNPNYKLDVYGSLKIGTTGALSIGQSPYSTTIFYIGAGNGSEIAFGAPASNTQNVSVQGDLYSYQGSVGTKINGSFNNKISYNGDNYLNSGNLGIGTFFPQSKLQVNGGVQLANDTASPSASKVGTFRYRTSGNNSYVDMCMQTGTSTYAWVNIVTNSW